MADLSVGWGGDLSVAANGDLLLCDGADQANQRVVRRLLTNPGDYIWSLSYGGGLALSVGEPMDGSKVEAIIRRQLQLESIVSSTPEPTITVTTLDPASGTFIAEIQYSDAVSGESRKISIPQG